MNGEQLRHTTVDRPVEVEGVTLFRAVTSRVVIRPADAGTGIRLRRTDLEGQPDIAAIAQHAVRQERRTTLRLNDDVSVETVEHVLSALAGLGITDAWIDLDAPELPIGDGSASLFADPLVAAGCRDLGTRTEPTLTITEPIVIEEGSSRIECHPTDEATTVFEYHLDYGPDAPLEPQTFRYTSNGASTYAGQVAPARTFATTQEVQALRAAGLFGHLSPRDLLVIGPDGPVENAYRFPDEPARHKVLDMIGDLSLIGRPVRARFVGVRSGHDLNCRMAFELASMA